MNFLWVWYLGPTFDVNCYELALRLPRTTTGAAWPEKGIQFSGSIGGGSRTSLSSSPWLKFCSVASSTPIRSSFSCAWARYSEILQTTHLTSFRDTWTSHTSFFSIPHTSRSLYLRPTAIFGGLSFVEVYLKPILVVPSTNLMPVQAFFHWRIIIHKNPFPAMVRPKGQLEVALQKTKECPSACRRWADMRTTSAARLGS